MSPSITLLTTAVFGSFVMSWFSMASLESSTFLTSSSYCVPMDSFFKFLRRSTGTNTNLLLDIFYICGVSVGTIVGSTVEIAVGAIVGISVGFGLGEFVGIGIGVVERTSRSCISSTSKTLFFES